MATTSEGHLYRESKLCCIPELDMIIKHCFFRRQPYNRRRAAIVSVAHLQGLDIWTHWMTGYVWVGAARLS